MKMRFFFLCVASHKRNQIQHRMDAEIQHLGDMIKAFRDERDAIVATLDDKIALLDQRLKLLCANRELERDTASLNARLDNFMQTVEDFESSKRQRVDSVQRDAANRS